MKTKHFILYSLLICLLFAFLPNTDGYAAGPQHIHPHATFDIPVGSADALSVSGDAYLTADITLTSDVVINEVITLCLNGYDINMGGYSIIIEPAGDLSIVDCPENPDGSFIVGSGDKAAIEVFGALNVFGGNYVTEGRPIVFNRGNTTIAGGKMSGPDSQLVQTSGSAMLNMSFGEIIASGSGSAIAMIEAPEDATAKARDYNAAVVGGTVHASAGSPGTILVNAPKGRFVLNTGANITGADCPAIKVENGKFDAYGGAVVYSDTESAIVGTGGNIGLYFADITSDEKYGVDISENAELLLSGSLDVVGGNAGVRLAEGKVFSMSDYGFYGDVRISIHTDVVPTEGNPVPISKPCSAKHYSHFLSATPSSSILYQDEVIYNSYDGSVSHSHEGRNYVLALSGGYTDLSKNNFYLEGDLSCNGFYTGSVVNICLNGHTLNLGSAIKMYPGSTLNIYDCQGTGQIVSNYTCVQDINGGGARLIVHQGTIASSVAAPVKLTGDDTVIVKGGQIVAASEGISAIEVTGLNNSISVDSGSIKGGTAAVSIVDGAATISGKADGSFIGNYVAQCGGFGEGLLTVDGNPGFESTTADILLASKKLLAVGDQLNPDKKISVLSESIDDVVVLSAASEKDISAYFVSKDETKAMMCAEENVLQLVKSMPASPESAEIFSGESAEFKLDYTGSGTPAYQWYIRDLASGSTDSIGGATSAVLTTPSGLASGSYELYCTVKDENGTYVGDTLILEVKKDIIENVSVAITSDAAYTGEPIELQLSSSASTTMGKNVNFKYSLDGTNFSEAMPTIGPEAGEYTIYYLAEAEGCESVNGQLSFTIEAEELPELPEVGSFPSLSPRLLIIIGSAVVLSILCILFAIQLIKKKLDD